MDTTGELQLALTGMDELQLAINFDDNEIPLSPEARLQLADGLAQIALQNIEPIDGSSGDEENTIFAKIQRLLPELYQRP